jgi:hypothetical protein
MKSTVLTNELVLSALSKDSENVLLRHLHSFGNNDLEALMSDYTEQSVLITYDQTYNGRDEIKTFFKELMSHFPKEDSNFKLEKLVVNDELGFIVWQASTPSLQVSLGTDTFLIKGGKIYQQTFAGQMKFLN